MMPITLDCPNANIALSNPGVAGTTLEMNHDSSRTLEFS